MAKAMNRLALAALATASFMFGSCRNGAPSTAVLRGNLTYSRGQYQRSILHYLNAEDTAEAGRDVVFYDLANVYFALGEGDAALRAWSIAEESTDDADLLFRIAFNRGVLHYKRGQYDEAYRAFRQALLIRPADLDAKVNLEESFSRVRSTVPAEGSDESSGGGNESDADRQRLLDYIRRKEADAWTSMEEPGSIDTRDW